MSGLRYVVLIPVYNHPAKLPDLSQYIISLKLPLMIVDDGSNTDCALLIDSLASDYPNEIQVVRHVVNQGKGAAVMTGLQAAFAKGFSHALQIDADGQHQWQDIEKFIQVSTQHPHATVIGCPVFDSSVPKGRLYGRYVTHVWVWINSLSLQIKDSMCGFRVYRTAPCEQLIKNVRMSKRMGFDSEVLVRLFWQGESIINLPTKVIYPEDGVSHFRVLEDNIGLSKMHARLFVGMLVRLPVLLWRKIHPRLAHIVKVE